MRTNPTATWLSRRRIPDQATSSATRAETTAAAAKSEPDAAGGERDREPRHSRQEDGAVEGEVDDSRPFGDRLPDRGVDERCGGGDDRGEGRFHQPRPSLTAPSMLLRRLASRRTELRSRTSKPWMTAPSDESRSSRSWSWDDPTEMAAKKRAIGATQRPGCGPGAPPARPGTRARRRWPGPACAGDRRR